ncbi:MAG TPA: nucleotidyltransferase family protein [Aliidongia sp.]|nr:nucleotidyltransferase family protein [Aliidongia sp.]
MNNSINPEFALVAACCLWPPSPDRNKAILGAAAGPIDWARFLRVVARHRVPGLAWSGLSRAGIAMPTDVVQKLKTDAGRVARANLVLCAETVRLQRLFGEAGLACAFLKGAAVAALAYDDIGIRHAKDIDMIVADADLAAASDLLIAAGYRRTSPPGAISPTQLALWRRHGKDMAWRHHGSGIELELHWRLTDVTYLLNEPFDFSALQPVRVTPSAEVAALPPAELFGYLCVHGAFHGWSRLKWLADINALLAPQPADLITSYYEFARKKGLERAVAPALLLCKQIFGLRLPAPLAAELSASRVTRLLARLSLLVMTRGGAETEVYDVPFGTSLISISHLLMAKNWRHWGAEVWRKSINLDDIFAFPLPRRLDFLYPMLRWPLWLARRFSNAGVSATK